MEEKLINAFKGEYRRMIGITYKTSAASLLIAVIIYTILTLNQKTPVFLINSQFVKFGVMVFFIHIAVGVFALYRGISMDAPDINVSSPNIALLATAVEALKRRNDITVLHILAGFIFSLSGLSMLFSRKLCWLLMVLGVLVLFTALFKERYNC